MQKDPSSHRRIWWNLDSAQELETEVVWSGLKVFWFRQFCRAQWKLKEEEVDRKRGVKTILKSGQEWSLPAQLGQLKTGQGGKGLLWNHLWCPDMTLQGCGIELNRPQVWHSWRVACQYFRLLLGEWHHPYKRNAKILGDSFDYRPLKSDINKELPGIK